MEPFAAFSFLLLATFTYILTLCVRKVAEYSFPALKKSVFWLDIFLPFFPAALGAAFGYFAKDFGFPTEIGSIALARIAFGSVAGFFSAACFRVVKSFLGAKSNSLNKGEQ
jgi:hypothetical protein